jgi:3-oxoacyl-[acyl-carrier protein] reductase
MNLHLENKKVLITGATRGLGLGIAKAFLSEGSVVTIMARNIPPLTDMFGEPECYRNNFYCISADATIKQDVENCVKTATDKMNGLDILVNNIGGISNYASFFDLEEADWMDAYKRNIMSIVNFVKYSYSYLKLSKTPRIINVSSLVGLQPGTFNPHYAACKAASINLTKLLSNIFADDKILVNSIAAAQIDTDSWKRNVSRVSEELGISFQDAEAKETELACKSIPLKRIGTSGDIVPMVLLLASDLSSWTTGSCIVLDGGKVRSIR